MLEKTITYIDYDGVERTETHHFHLSESELIEMSVSEEGGLDKYIARIRSEQDIKKLFALFKSLIWASYGVKSPDGKRFIKNNEVKEEFTQTEAYNQLFVELTTDTSKALDFIQGILPAKLQKEIADKLEELKKPQ